MRDIIKAIFKTGSSSIVNIVLAVISSKILAVVLGSSGVGLYSLINQTLTTATTAGTMGGQTALVQGIASKQGAEKDNYLVTVFWIFLSGALITALVFLLFPSYIAQTIFASNEGKTISLVRWMALPTVLTIIYYYLINLLNGFRAIGRLAIGQIILSTMTVILVYPASKLVSNGYLIAFILMISVSTLGGIIFCLIVAHKEKWLNPLIINFLPKFDKVAVRHFYQISSTTLITSLMGTGILLGLRTIIIRDGGLSSVGIFSAAWSLSMVYVSLVLGSFGTYYLPTLSGINDVPSRNNLIQDLFKITIILIVPLIVTVMMFKSFYIAVFYTHEFMPSLEIIRWMLLGDYFKVSSWIFSMPMLAYKDMKVFFWAESLWNIGFLTLSYVGLFYFKDLQTVGIAFLIVNAFYFVFTMFYAYRKHGVTLSSDFLAYWTLGLLLIIIASWQTWRDMQVNWISASIWIAITIAFSWMTLKKEEKAKLIKMIYKREV